MMDCGAFLAPKQMEVAVQPQSCSAVSLIIVSSGPDLGFLGSLGSNLYNCQIAISCHVARKLVQANQRKDAILCPWA